tara:strand:+ start:133 stop:603 length:471 start_codon:yes stop_codon:yes gene_type:complete
MYKPPTKAPAKKPPQQRPPAEKEKDEKKKEPEDKKPSEKETFESKTTSRRDMTVMTKRGGTTRKDGKKTETYKTREMPKRQIQKKEAGLYTETRDVKEGGLRAALKVGKDYKFTIGALTPLLKIDVGKKFTFQGKEFTMTEKLKKQIQLALNMLRN